MGRPVPTVRALWVAALSLVPAALAVLWPAIAPLLLAFDLALLVVVLADFALAPRADVLRLRRIVEPVFSSGRANLVQLELTLAPGARGPVHGELRDWVTPGPAVSGHRQRFEVSATSIAEWKLTPGTRGDLTFGPVTLRFEGPLGLCARQVRVELPATVKVFPDLSVLSRDALTLARAEDQASRRVVRVRSEGREFESLREYRPGDDRRTIDWKATARRGKPFVRQHQPERNQQVLLLLDCGRHMAGEVEGRRKLDHAVDAALRLAKVALDQGDLVGVMAFGRDVKRWLPPRKGAEQLRAIAQALYRVEAALEESNYGAAIDQAFARGARRSLVIVLTDLLDPDAAHALVLRTRRLVPRHLPMVVSLQDADVHRVATAVPETTAEAYERVIAARVERDGAATAAKLRESGAHVVRGTPAVFASAGVHAYLDIKQRGLL
ncbi:MAG: DUF58 domain-containing protein [Myxococcota bacterium]